jgi:hypothetical protein
LRRYCITPHVMLLVVKASAFTMARSTIITLYLLVVMVTSASAARLQPSLKLAPVLEEPQSGCSPSQVTLSPLTTPTLPLP